jgi:hypothetical protein
MSVYPEGWPQVVMNRNLERPSVEHPFNATKVVPFSDAQRMHMALLQTRDDLQRLLHLDEHEVEDAIWELNDRLTAALNPERSA